MSDVVTRFGRAVDAGALHGFIVGLAEYVGHPEQVEVTADELAEQLARSPAPFECLIAEIDGAPVGSAIFFTNYSTWRGRNGLYLEDIFVPEEHRRKGIARALFQHLAQLVIDRGHARLDWAVVDWNETAIGFYEGLGARPDTLHRLWCLDRDALSAVATFRW